MLNVHLRPIAPRRANRPAIIGASGMRQPRWRVRRRISEKDAKLAQKLE